MADAMTNDAAYAFIDALPARTGKLATTRANGAPHVAPVWVALDGETIVFTTHAETLKGRALRRDPRVAMCFDDEAPPFSFLVVEGEVELSEDPAELLHWATVIAGRYMGPEQAEAYGRRNGVAGELLVRLRPSKLVGATNVSD